jgi:1-acyl-sn-glycerol-3-phosphate acyltransferase
MVLAIARVPGGDVHSALLTTRRFGPLFATQFLGAFNDNFFKNALVILIAFRAVSVGGLPPESMVALSAAVFILPYFLFSATAGQLADKLDKSAMIRWTKNAEIGVMTLGAAGFALGSVPMLLFVLFLMGLQSTVFGPCKYGILPQLLDDDELVTGNALVELGTYLAILLGTLAGGLMVSVPQGEWVVAGGVLVIAAAGRGVSHFVPATDPQDASLQVRWEPIRPTWELIRLCREERSIWLSILGISWFWLFGSAFLSLFPPYTKDVLGGTEGIATLFLALFSVGIGIGSMGCERLSRERLELGLVPLGAFGMSVCTLSLFLIGTPWQVAEPMGVLQFASRPMGWLIAASLLGLAVSGGFLIVPLYTLVQQRAPDDVRARIIAGNNVVNAAFMVLGSLGLVVLQQLGLDPVAVFGVLALLNLICAVYMYSVVREFLLRFVAWMLSVVVYRVNVVGHHHVPDTGGAVLVCNHVSFIDWFVIMASVKRPARFVMYKGFFEMPLVSFLFKQAGCIPIASRKEGGPEALEKAFDQISADLKEGWVVCIFPEGRITDNGAFYPFKPGVERILARDPVPVVPMALNGLWGSFFSRKEGKAMSKPFRRGLFSRVTLTIGAPLPPNTKAEELQEAVHLLWSGRPDAP